MHDVIVIGTGYGGAVTAARLAEAGMRVAILERGTWWGKARGERPLPETLREVFGSIESLNINAFDRSFRLSFSRARLLEQHLHGNLWMMNAIGVGGTSLVNGALMQRPSKAFFDAFPSEVTHDELAPYYSEVERRLGVSSGPVNEDSSRRHMEVARTQGWEYAKASQAIRFPASAVEHASTSESVPTPVPGICTQCNKCIVGCNHGAKASLDQTYILDALGAGAELRDLCRVEGLIRTGGGYEVTFVDLRTKKHMRLEARGVVLAAGTLNTHRILFRSRDVSGGLGNISDRLGQASSLGADTIGWYRLPKGVLPTEIEGHSAEIVLNVSDEAGQRDFSIGLLKAPSIPGSALLRAVQGNRTLSAVGFGVDDMNSAITWNGKDIRFRQKEQAVVGRIKAAMDELALAHGWEPSRAKHDPTRPGRSWMSVHPMGGCTMATDPSAGMVDFRGEVFGAPGLFVADASIFASAPGAGPALSIAALSSFIAARILEEAGSVAA